MALASRMQPDCDLLFNDDEWETETAVSQMEVEADVDQVFRGHLKLHGLSGKLPLFRTAHINYITRSLNQLGQSFTCLDSSRPWLVYWMLQSLSVLGQQLEQDVCERAANFLSRCQCSSGGFGGGPQQKAHLAPTYAAINALCLVGTEDAYSVVDRVALMNFIKSVKCDDGSFQMESDGEVDSRGAYCAVSAAKLCGLPLDDLFSGTAEWIASCQTYEGGFGAAPYGEAHGGYTFCSVAALILLERTELIDVDSLLHWATSRQMRYEGGFQGRTNKLVDGCYAHWVGGLFPLLDYILRLRGQTGLDQDWLYDRVSLQTYLLLVSQRLHGGFVDKPGKSADYYHTCYALSGLSAAQNYKQEGSNSTARSCLVVGDIDDLLCPTHFCYVVDPEKAKAMIAHYTE